MSAYKVEDLDILIIPEITVEDLLEQVVKNLSINHVSSNIQNWNNGMKMNNTLRALRDKKFAVQMLTKLKPKSLSFDQVRAIFSGNGYKGDICLFFYWILQNETSEFNSTLPDEDGMFINPHNQELSTLYYDKQKESHLYLMDKSGKCSPGQKYFAFKEII